MLYKILRVTILLITVLFSAPLIAQITVDFEGDNTEGCGSLQVNYTDLSTSTAGDIVEWLWDIGGITSTNESPSRIYGTPGEYTICLTVTDSEGNSDMICKDNYIKVYENPTAVFSVSADSGCTPLDIEFFDLSLSPNGSITSWIQIRQL